MTMFRCELCRPRCVVGSSKVMQQQLIFHLLPALLFLAAPKPDIPVSSHWSATNKGIERRSMFKPDVDSEENKEARSSNDCRRRGRQKREELVVKKRELAERQAAAAAAAATAAAHENEQEDTAPTPVVPDAAFSNVSADADLNDRIEEIENDMQETFAEFQNIGTKNMDVMDEE